MAGDDTSVVSVTKTEGRQKLERWLNKSMKIKMTDGRTLIGVFLCTDRDRNVILGSCEEYLRSPDDDDSREEPRILGLAMVPGHHIVSIHIDEEHCVIQQSQTARSITSSDKQRLLETYLIKFRISLCSVLSNEETGKLSEMIRLQTCDPEDLRLIVHGFLMFAGVQ